MPDPRLRRINLQIPNEQLGEWLKGPECRAKIEEITHKVFTLYQNALPVRSGNLRRGAYYTVGYGGWGTDQDRWFGWVGNRALSYRPTRGKRYPAAIEYGIPRRGIPGQHQLANAVAAVAGGMVQGGPTGRSDVWRDSRGRWRDRRGRFVRRPN